jgi:outer membrane lipoprotein
MLGFVCFSWLLAGCAGAPPVMQEGALPRMPLTDLISNEAGYRGQTVVMGGYVLEVENQQGQTRIVAVQVPIDSGQRLDSRDLSEGRLILIYDGFIDPEVYKKDRGITVRGEIIGGAANDPDVPYPYLRIQVREIHLWPEEKPSDPKYDPFHHWYRHYPYGRYPYWYYPYYPYPFYRYPYWR